MPQALKLGVRLLQIEAARRGIFVLVTSGRRTRRQQARLYRRFLLGIHPYPVAPPGRSKHELGLAVDLIAEPRSRLRELGEYWERLGGRWGGRFGDPIHFEI